MLKFSCCFVIYENSIRVRTSNKTVSNHRSDRRTLFNMHFFQKHMLTSIIFFMKTVQKEDIFNVVKNPH